MSSSDYNFGQYSNGGGGTQDAGDHDSGSAGGGNYPHPNNATDYTEVAKDVAVLFLIGVAIIIALISLVYVGAMFCDRFCRRCGLCGSLRALHTDEPRHVQGGEVARDAGLTGMTEAERRAVLDKILVGRPYHTCRESADNSDGGNENNENNLCKDDNKDGQQSSDTTDDDTADNSTISPGSESAAAAAQDIESPSPSNQFESDSYIACAICIDEYGPSDEVVIGEACWHMFHKECVLDWLQRHDGCPCCRKNMMTSEQMKDAAVEVLGRHRIMQLALGPYSATFGFDDVPPRIGIPQAMPDVELGNVADSFQNDGVSNAASMTR